MSTKTVSAIYSSPLMASDAISLLKANGYREGELSILASDSSIEKNIKIEENSKAPEGIAMGATVGGTLGAVAAGLTAVGTVTLTGGLGLVAAGPVIAAFAGAGAGAATGGIVGGLVGMGIPETEARIIDERIGTGDIMIGVTVDSNNQEDTKKILEKSGAENISVH